MMTLSGVLLNKDTVDAAPTILDMATGLSRIVRFGGQTLRPWTVGQHLLACAALARASYPGWTALELHALLHDAHESMTSDVPTSWKTDDLKVLQQELDRRIYWSLGVGLPTRTHALLVAALDTEMLLAEASLVTPRATYDRICVEHHCRPAASAAREAVRGVLMQGLSQDDVRDEWGARVIALLPVKA